MERDKQRVVIWVLAVLLVLSLSYTGYGVYKNVKSKQQLGLVQAGAQYGFESAVVEIMQQAATCQAVPLTANNVTLNLIAVECLRLPQQQPQQ